MATPSAQQEPTMEEILASIRRIISEDADGGKAPASEPAPQPMAVAAAPDNEVLELTHVVQDDGSVGRQAEPPPEPPRRRAAPRPEPEPVREPPPEPRVVRRPPPPPEPRYTRNQSDLDMVEKEEGILSSQASSAVSSAFGMLAREREVSVSSTTLEEIVTQIMRPLLAQWLDEHLPDIVERVVQQEVERAARNPGRRR
jgi:cell pole-organizing protein PopZ